ncbi:MAG: hypothetical protein H0V17_18340 [Deltaproteobacteria bacterium]|nr:hypothetical protein [Deltaproteobacteria bacterium]
MRIAFAACLVLCACAHNVPQDKATTADGRIKGAKPIVLENGAATATGVVTYPGGDRVDWKKIELPEKHRGELDIKLTWSTPRPGLKLTFDVFDAWNAQVAVAKRTTKLSREASVKDARGTYFIRVYAVGRGDAGRYKLGIEFDGRERVPLPPIEVNEPPKLPDLPVVVEVKQCDLYKFDPSNPDCEDKCPVVTSQAPPNWKGCAKVCTVSPPDAAIPACAKTMACPPGGDVRVASCRKEDFRPCPDFKNPDPTNLNCLDHQWAPVAARIGKKTVIGGEVEITIMAGAKSNIDNTWTAIVLQGDTGKPLAGGAIKILRIDDNTIIGRVRLTAQQVEANLQVLVTPPPKPKRR